MPEERARIWLNVLSSFTKIKEDTESFNSEKVSGLESCGPETATPFAVAGSPRTDTGPRRGPRTGWRWPCPSARSCRTHASSASSARAQRYLASEANA